ncbi:NAD(P)H-dependent oxidoreductase [Alsobacter sp. SYSU M60028]|uniref:NAD(P)H-dependent oxidoreductase n=1 Tax=Alsobacter ponti TaxID=2962936 RepID=A0ABT1LA02_9HYPH|nr:NAD(P)H-dependent oxidoreductase [Alsobacter ponti]MCP8938274.1 NAD(P)H-dependent oxidoreductase [Alsobacter ponti]
MTRILILQGHPDPAPGHLCDALAKAYAEGARAAGHDVEMIEIATLDVPFLRTQEAFEHAGPPPSLADAAGALARAQHIVLVFPLWLGTMPALVKAFLEQTFRPGVAFAYREKGFPEKKLAGRSARIVVTMGMPAFVYRWFYMAHGVQALKRSILNFVGISPVRVTYLGGVGGASASAREGWLARMRELGRSAA